MSVDTLGVRFSAEGSENILNLIKQITSATGQLDGEIKKLTQTSQQASSGIGPAFSNLGNAISSGEQKVKSLTEKFGGLQSAISRQGTAFGTATASVWGIYNAYDSLEKVQLRASQASVRVETLTTSLRSQEEQLRLAREAGNLTAEQVSVREERIIDTKQKLEVAMEREQIMVGDVSEAWASFASLIGPQVISAVGSISQLVAGLTMAGEGQISTLGRMRGAFSSLIGSLSLTRTSGLAVNSTFAQMPIFTGAAEVGVRGLSGALKGLLIGTGIGAVIVAIGLLTEGFGLLGDSSAELAKQTNANFAEAAAAPGKYQEELSKRLELATAIQKKYVADTTASLDNLTAAHVKQMKEQAEIELGRAEIWKAKADGAKVFADAEIKRLEDLDKQYGFLTDTEAKHQEQMQKMSATSAASSKEQEAIISSLTTEIQLYSDVLPELVIRQNNAATAQDGYNQFIAELPQFMKQAIADTDAWIATNQKWILQFPNAEAAIAGASKRVKEITADETLLTTVTEHLKVRIEELIPAQEKLAKEAEKDSDAFQKWRDKALQLVDRFKVEIPEAFIGSQDALDAFGDALARNQAKIDEFNKRTEFLDDISGLEKAFDIEFEIDKEVKDFLKDLPKDIRKKMELIIDTKSDLAGVKNLWEIMAPAIFGKSEVVSDNGETTMTVWLRPEWKDPQDIQEIAETMIDSLEDQFGKDTNNPVVKSLIEDLKNADTDEELKAAFAKIGINLENTLLEDAEKVGLEAGKKIASSANTGFSEEVTNSPLFDAILGNSKQKGVVTKIDPKTGKQTIVPVDGETKKDFSDMKINAESAKKEVEAIFTEMEKALGKIFLGIAKNWSGMMNSMMTNAKASQSGVTKTFLNMSGEASNIFLGLASNWSKMMNSMIANAKSAANGINKALDGIKDQDVAINVSLQGEGAAYLDSGGAIHLAKGGVISSAAAGQVYMTNGPQLVLIGDNPGGNEIHAMIPKNDPLPTVRSLLGVLGNMGGTSNSSITNSSTVNNFGGGGPIIINITSPVYLDSQKIGEAVNHEVIGNLDRFYRS